MPKANLSSSSLFQRKVHSYITNIKEKNHETNYNETYKHTHAYTHIRFTVNDHNSNMLELYTTNTYTTHAIQYNLYLYPVVG